MTRQVDARGLPCPHPVISTRKALQEIEQGEITVLVDRPDASENVQRFARGQGCDVTVTERDGVHHLEIVKRQAAQGEAKATSQVVLVGSDKLGTGDAALGSRLMKSFLATMCDAGPRPARMLFVNEGVRLTTQGSEVLDALGALEREGVEILSCGTCLEHYDLVEKLEVGLVTNMFDIVDSLLTGDKVIRI
jgi:selenium metabolism protein YedF